MLECAESLWTIPVYSAGRCEAFLALRLSCEVLWELYSRYSPFPSPSDLCPYAGFCFPPS